jgi:hypothetical protein
VRLEGVEGWQCDSAARQRRCRLGRGWTMGWPVEEEEVAGESDSEAAVERDDHIIAV